LANVALNGLEQQLVGPSGKAGSNQH
jgi:hypothetical protein